MKNILKDKILSYVGSPPGNRRLLFDCIFGAATGGSNKMEISIVNGEVVGSCPNKRGVTSFGPVQDVAEYLRSAGLCSGLNSLEMLMFRAVVIDKIQVSI